MTVSAISKLKTLTFYIEYDVKEFDYSSTGISSWLHAFTIARLTLVGTFNKALEISDDDDRLDYRFHRLNIPSDHKDTVID